MRAYEYKVYDTYMGRKKHIMDVSTNSIDGAIKKAGFDWLFDDPRGWIVKSREGLGYTNTKVYIYTNYWYDPNAPKPTPDFVMERVF